MTSASEPSLELGLPFGRVASADELMSNRGVTPRANNNNRFNAFEVARVRTPPTPEIRESREQLLQKLRFVVTEIIDFFYFTYSSKCNISFQFLCRNDAIGGGAKDLHRFAS